MASLYTTRELMATTALLPPVDKFILNTFFPRTYLSTVEEIDLDKVGEDRKIAAYVSPKVAAHTGLKEQRKINAYVPPSVIELDAIDANDITSRAVGEDLGKPLTPAERHAMAVQRWRQIHRDRIIRRHIMQGVEILRTGKVTVAGKNHPAEVIDYGRNAALTVVLSGTDEWGDDGVDPIEDLEDLSLAISEKGEGAVSKIVVMDTKAWRLFKSAASVKALLAVQRLAPVNIDMDPAAFGRGARFMGRFGDYDIWVYADTYVDPADSLTKKYLPDYTVIMGGPDMLGTMAFGGVALATEGGMTVQSGDIVPDMFVGKNPDGEFLRDQSRPLAIPVNVNACACLTVKSS